VRYHRAVAEVGVPLIVFQLQPALGGVHFSTETLRRLIDIDGVVAIKEASFDARSYVDTVRMIKETAKYQAGEFTILTGNDNFILESFLLGCTGALIGFGAVMTREQAQMIEAWRAGDVDVARALGARVQRLADVIFAAPVANYRARLKEALRLLGVLETAHVRLPLLELGDQERTTVRKTLEEVGLRTGAAA
jgi:4-hydroxy-tetrahydrodipicolinate synthase